MNCFLYNRYFHLVNSFRVAGTLILPLKSHTKTITVMKIKTILLPLIALLGSIFIATTAVAQTIVDNDTDKFRVTGYLRTGVGASEGGETQADFQMPGSVNRYILGNQADSYGELAFDYTHYLGSDKSKSLDAFWMVAGYAPYGAEDNMSFNKSEQLYLKANNLFGQGESIWFGKRYYERQSIYMLDRFWLNPGQGGVGGGIEGLLRKGGGEDLKIAAWQLKNRDITSHINSRRGDIATYTVDVRWVNKPISERVNLNLALNFSHRMESDELGYESRDGYGLFAWVDYKHKSITNTTALLFRHGSNISVNQWTGISQRENPYNDNLVTNDLNGAYSIELNNNFLYDNNENFAINAILMLVAQDYGTTPYYAEGVTRSYIENRGSMFYWSSVGARAMYYVSRHFRPTLEVSYEYGRNEQLDTRGSLGKITFSPELSLNKGYFSRPVLRPFVNYALWSDGLKGHVGTTPMGAPYGDATAGFTYGVQFEIWW